MAYPERKPIYDAYQEIVKEIINTTPHNDFAKAEINALNQALLEAFRSISQQLIAGKEWKKFSK